MREGTSLIYKVKLRLATYALSFTSSVVSLSARSFSLDALYTIKKDVRWPAGLKKIKNSI